MTTICVYKGIIAADSCETEEDTVVQIVKTKIFKVKENKKIGPFYVGFAGDSQEICAVLPWFQNNFEKEFFPDSFGEIHIGENHTRKVSALILTKDTKGFFFEGMPVLTPWEESCMKRPFAIGAGMDIALGALYAGASAVEAIRIAAKLNVYTRLPVRAFNVKDL